MKGDGERPMLYVFSTCVDFIRTVPSLQHDTNRPEDLDTDAEDHVADEARYGCMSRPYMNANIVQMPKKANDYKYSSNTATAGDWMTY